MKMMMRTTKEAAAALVRMGIMCVTVAAIVGGV